MRTFSAAGMDIGLVAAKGEIMNVLKTLSNPAARGGVVLALCAVLLPVLASAQGENATPADAAAVGQNMAARGELRELRAYLMEAAARNNVLRAAFSSWRAAVERVTQAESLPDPRLSFAYYTTPLETRGGPARYKYGLSQSLPFFGKLSLKGQVALREADGLKAKFDALKLATFAKVKKAYYEYAYLARAIETTREAIELIKYMEKIATVRYTAGAAGHGEVIRTQVELGKLEDRLRSLRALSRPQAATLNALLDRPAGEEIPLPPSVPVMRITEDKEGLVAQLASQNPELAYWDTVTAKTEAGKRLAERNYLPDFTFGLESTEVDDSRSPGMTGDGQNPVMVSMSVNVPLWLDARKAAVDEQSAKLRAARRSRAGLERQLRADLELALYNYEDAGRKIDLYKKTLIPKAKQALGVVVEAFMTGDGSALDLIDAEQTILELQLAYYRAVTDQAQRMAEMETLVGSELPCEFHGSLLPQDG